VTATQGLLAPRMALALAVHGAGAALVGARSGARGRVAIAPGAALAAAPVVLTRWSGRGRAPEAGADDEIDEVDLAAVRRGFQGKTP